MAKITKKDKRTKLEKEIDDVIEILNEIGPDKEEYGLALANLERLNKMKNDDRAFRIKPDTWLMAGIQLGSILLILNFERLNVITSKAFGYATKWRV